MVSDSNERKKKIIAEMLDAGMIMVTLDGRISDVVVPEHLLGDPQLRLNLSYRFGNALELTAWGIETNLSFGGVPHDVRLPWGAVYLAISHVDGQPFLFPDSVPTELLETATKQLEENGKEPVLAVAETVTDAIDSEPAAPKPALRLVTHDDDEPTPPPPPAPTPTPEKRNHLRVVK
ncbi:hypothetical protein KAI87_16960 [Myxococcota bacterium]|nr:hypothetical protein [Myxococcota bacterium]